jgi:hypothetical protein
MGDMEPHPIVASVALLSEMVCGFVSTIRILDMVDELNGKLSEKDSFSYLGWHWPKFKRFMREYERCFPDSPNPRYLRIGFVLMMGLLIVVAWSLGFFQ